MERNEDTILRELRVRDNYVRLPLGHLAKKDPHRGRGGWTGRGGRGSGVGRGGRGLGHGGPTVRRTPHSINGRIVGEVNPEDPRVEPGRCGRVVSVSACQAGGLQFESGILPLLKHACGESDQLLCWLYTPAKVLHQRWISGNIYHICLCKVRNPEETSLEVQNRGISGLQNGHVSNKNLKK